MESLLAYPLREWSFDPLTAFITVVVAPVFLLLLALLRTALKRWGRYAFEGVLYWLNRAVIHEMAATLTLKRYARLLLAGQSRFLLVPGKIDVPLAIEQVYVPLLLESADRAATFDHANLFECGNRIRILGDPGSGKSSIVKNLLRDECHRAVRRPRQARLAILLELRTLKAPFDLDEDALGDWLLRVLRDSVAANEIYKMAECLDNYARTSGLLVLLDGLDEVSSSAYPDAERAIIQLSQRLAQLSSENLIVLTMRTQFHHQVGVAYRMSFPGTLSLKRFSSSDIYDFLVRWPFPATREMHVARIYKDLNDRPTLREMCSNPLLLAMYVAEDQIAAHPIIPESRTEFYKE